MFALRRLNLPTGINRFWSTISATPSCDSEVKSPNLASPLINAHVQAAINEQINNELLAAYTYRSISYYFAKSSVGLMGFSKLYRTMYEEEMIHADTLAQYLLKRNGCIDLGSIKKPATCSWANISTTLNETVRLENSVSESLSNIYRLAEKHNDMVTADFIVTEFLKEQIESVRSVNLLIAKWRSLEKAPDGTYLMDRELEGKDMH